MMKRCYWFKIDGVWHTLTGASMRDLGALMAPCGLTHRPKPLPEHAESFKTRMGLHFSKFGAVEEPPPDEKKCATCAKKHYNRLPN